MNNTGFMKELAINWMGDPKRNVSLIEQNAIMKDLKMSLLLNVLIAIPPPSYSDISIAQDMAFIP